jgi:hypothetical protein
MAWRRNRDDDQVVVITQAPRPHSDEMDQRIGRYLVSMAIRTICVLLVFFVHNGPARVAFAIGAVFLPYVAVVMANAGYTRKMIRVQSMVLSGDSTPEEPETTMPRS